MPFAKLSIFLMLPFDSRKKLKTLFEIGSSAILDIVSTKSPIVSFSRLNVSIISLSLFRIFNEFLNSSKILMASPIEALFVTFANSLLAFSRCFSTKLLLSNSSNILTNKFFIFTEFSCIPFNASTIDLFRKFKSAIALLISFLENISAIFFICPSFKSLFLITLP